MSQTSTPLRRYTHDPSAALQQAFDAVYRERMRDLPLINPALRVEAVGFQAWQGHWLGVLITPWFVNLVLLPGAEGEWPALGLGEKLDLEAPSGRYGFVAGFEEQVGEYRFCSLMSPVKDFSSHAAAVATAAEVVRLFMLPPEHRELALQDQPAAAAADEKVSTARRKFLRGDFAAESD